MRLSKKLLYLLPSVIAFYIIPFILFLLAPILYYAIALFFLIHWYAINPIVCFVSPLIYGTRNRFKPSHLLFPVLLGVLYLSSLLIFFGIGVIYGYMVNYTFVYMFIALLGYVVGVLYNTYKRVNNR